MELLEQILLESWNVLCLSAPYMLLGFFIAGLLKAFIPDQFIARHLGQEKSGNLFKAAFFGVPIPLCSCGVLPAAAGIRKQGAGKGPTAAFLISTPETGVDSIAVTWALLDPLMAVLRPVAAFFTALFTGQLVRIFDSERSPAAEPSEPAVATSCACSATSCCALPASPPSRLSRLRSGMSFAFGDLFRDIAGWFFVGVLVAGLISVFVSPVLIDRWLGNPLVAMFAMLIIATPLYVCATASTPIAAALVLKGLNPGAALVFLLAGPATNAAALSVISTILGRKSTLLYLAGIIASALLLGVAVDLVYSLGDFTAGWQGAIVDEQRSLVGTLSAILLLVLVLFPVNRGKQAGIACECC